MEPFVDFYHPALIPEQFKDGTSSPPTILVINQSTAVREYLHSALDFSYRVEEAVDNNDGLRLAKKMMPDLIIMDLNSPTGDDALCFQLKRCEWTSHIPIVVLTQQDDQNCRLKSFYLGADDFMKLPLQEVELQVRIQNLIESRKKLMHKFSHLVELKAVDTPSENEVFIQKVMKVIEENMANPLFGSEQFARELGLSQTKLYRKLTSLTGYSSNDFIRRIRLQRAAELLDKQVGNVSDVAYQVGFNSLSYFAKCFRAHYKSTPREYAKRIVN